MKIDKAAFTQEDYKSHRAFWTTQLQAHSMPFRFPDVTVSNDSRQLLEAAKNSLSQGLSENIQRICHGRDAAVLVLMWASLALLLKRYSGKNTIVIHTPASRIGPHAELNKVIPIGICIQEQQQVAAYLNDIREITQLSYAFQGYPIEILGDMAGQFKSNVLFYYDQVHVERGNDEVDHDLIISVSRAHSSFTFSIQYNQLLFSESFINRLFNDINAILEHMVRGIKTATITGILHHEKQDNEDDDFICVPPPGRDTSTGIVQLFENQAATHPDRVAIVAGELHLTYREAEINSRRIAAFLKSHCNVSKEQLIGLMADRSELLPLGIWGILRAGCVYVPVDPSLPAGRKDFILADADIRILLTTADHIQVPGVQTLNIREIMQIPEKQTYTPATIAPGDAAYAMYTSGTTGKPKGVLVEHRNVMSLSAWLTEYIYKSEENPLVAVLTASASFDASVQQLFAPLLNGAVLVIIPEEVKADILQYCAAVTKYAADVIDITPSYLKVVLQTLEEDNSSLPVRYTLVGGEVLKPSVAALYYSIAKKNSRLINVYGLTETTVNSCFCEIAPAGTNVHVIGRPLPGTGIGILDIKGNIMPGGLTGEICISGDGVGRGYLNRVMETTDRYWQRPGNKGWACRTGDLGRWTDDGCLEYVGRSDQQLKINGLRIGLAEVEAALLQLPTVKDAVIKTTCDRKGEYRMVAYVTCNHGTNSSKIKEELQYTLPPYMIPEHIVCLQNFPLTVSGKLHLDALPIPWEMLQDRVLPDNEMEAALLREWADALNNPNIGVTDDFTQVGGHSLNAMQIISRLNKVLGIKIPLSEFFLASTIRQLADYIQTIPHGESGNTIPAAPPQTDYPLSHAQQRMWILSLLDGGNRAYNIFNVIKLKNLDTAIFEQSIWELLKRHEILRTGFVEMDGVARQRVERFEDIEFRVLCEDLRLQAEGAHSPAYYIEKEIQHCFDLCRPPLMRVRILLLPDNDSLLLLNMHHIISDEWSMKVFATELLEVYATLRDGRKLLLPSPTLQYKDFACWHNIACLQQSEYWHALFEKRKIIRSVLPFDHPSGACGTFSGKTLTLCVPDSIALALREMAVEIKVTPNTLFFGLYTLLISRWMRLQEGIIGLLVSNRTAAGTERMIGPFINYLPIPYRLQEELTIKSYLIATGKTLMKAYMYQDYPFDKMVEHLAEGRSSLQNPIFGTLFNFHALRTTGVSGNDPSWEAAGLKIQTVHTDTGTASLPLQMDVLDNGKIELHLSYQREYFSEQTITRLLEAYTGLLQQVLANPGAELKQIEIFDEAARKHNREKLRKASLQRVLSETMAINVYTTFDFSLAKTYMEYWMKAMDITADIYIHSCERSSQIQDGQTPVSTVNIFLISSDMTCKPPYSFQQDGISTADRYWESVWSNDAASGPLQINLLLVIPSSVQGKQEDCSFLAGTLKKMMDELDHTFLLDTAKMEKMYAVDRQTAFTDEYVAALGTYLARVIHTLAVRDHHIIAFPWQLLMAKETGKAIQALLLEKRKAGFLLAAYRYAPCENDGSDMLLTAGDLDIMATSFAGVLQQTGEAAASTGNIILITSDQMPSEENPGNHLRIILPEEPDEWMNILNHVWELDGFISTFEYNQAVHD